MSYFFRYTIDIVAASLVLINIVACGEESVQQESRFLAMSDEGQFNNITGQQELIHPTIDITANGFVSHLASTNWEFGTEVLIMHTDFGSVDFNDEGGDSKAATGMRFVLGWESYTGFGIRARLMGLGIEGSTDNINFFGHNSARGPVIEGFEYSGAPSTSANSEPTELSAGVVDVDFYKHFSQDQSDIFVGVGFRSAGFETVVPNIILNTIHTGGVSLFAELRHVIYQNDRSEFAVVGGGRVSYLTGEWESKVISDMIEVETDMKIGEGALGVEWSRKLRRSHFVLLAQYETQLWESDVTNDLTFNGGVIRAGLRW